MSSELNGMGEPCYLCEHLVRIFVVIQQHRNLGVVPGSFPEELAELPLHRLHRGA